MALTEIDERVIPGDGGTVTLLEDSFGFFVAVNPRGAKGFRVERETLAEAYEFFMHPFALRPEDKDDPFAVALRAKHIYGED